MLHGDECRQFVNLDFVTPNLKYHWRLKLDDVRFCLSGIREHVLFLGVLFFLKVSLRTLSLAHSCLMGNKVSGK